jgi:tetratricopeptide (TPR) repeat protein
MGKKSILKVLTLILVAIVLFVGSIFGTYKYSQQKNFKNLVSLASRKLSEGDYDNAIKLYTQALNYKDDKNIKAQISLAQLYKKNQYTYNEGLKLMDSKKYSEAIRKFSTIAQSAGQIYNNAQSKISECKKQFIAQNIQLANDSAKNNKYDDAIKYLDQILKLDADNSEAKNLKNAFQKMSILNANVQTTKINETNAERGNGNMRGVITWQYNNFIGTKPDNGANIVLISRNKNRNSDNAAFTVTLKQNPSGKNGIYTAEADGYGNYEMDDVPTGQYYVLIKSNKTRSNMTIDSNTASILQGLFSESDWSKLQTTLKLNKYILKTVEIKPNKTIIESYDFGYTYF